MSSASYWDFSYTSTELSVYVSGGWAVGKNIAGNEYPGRDTTAKDVMFSVVDAGITQFSIRVGADNQSSDASQRLRSVYFKKFNYPNSILPLSDLLAFKGVNKNSFIDLEWSLAPGNITRTIVLEKSTTGNTFNSVAEFWPNMEEDRQTRFSYSDKKSGNAVDYYRLKLISATGKVEYSNILSFRSEPAAGTAFKLYPTVVQSSATLQLNSMSASPVLVYVSDLSGRMIMQQRYNTEKGINNLQLNGFEKLIAGAYVVNVQTGNQKMSQHIIKK